MNDLNLYEVLSECVFNHRPQSYLEIGVQEGNSLKTVLKADTEKRISKLHLCDLWGTSYGGTGRGSHDHVYAVLKSINFQGEVTFLDGDSKVKIPELKEKFDMILIDGDHSEVGCTIDMINAWPLLNTGGIMLIDDIIHPAHKYLFETVSRFVAEWHSDILNVEFRTEKANGVAIIHKRTDIDE